MNEAISCEVYQALKQRERIALVTIISTQGSTPRKAGACMIVRRDGRVTGTIGGGCSEADVRLRALQALDDNESFCMEVRMLNDAAAEEGMVCGGVMQVFIQVLAEEQGSPPDGVGCV